MSRDLFIEAGKNTPKVIGSEKDGILKFDGNSFPENVRTFYDPVSNWIGLIKGSAKKITIDSKFYYMASSSVIAFLRILKKAEKVFGKEQVTIIWRFEEGDDDIQRIGEDFENLLDIKVEFKEEEE